MAKQFMDKDFDALTLDAANVDWIRAARLQKKALAGDKEAEKKLQELFDTKMED